MPPGIGYPGKPKARTRTGPTKKTRTVARIAKAKGVSRKAANVIRKKRKASPTKAQQTRRSNRANVQARANAIGKPKSNRTKDQPGSNVAKRARALTAKKRNK